MRKASVAAVVCGASILLFSSAVRGADQPAAEPATTIAAPAPSAAPAAKAPKPPPPLIIAPAVNPVSDADMHRIYDELKTPFKFGIVVDPAEGELTDCPSVFRYSGKWYMLYVTAKDKIGYETCLAESDDLLHWNKLGKILPFSGSGWDQWQADGGIALEDPEFGGTNELQTYDGKYWLSFIGGAKQGYETPPLAIGVAWTKAPDKAEPWTRLAENPVLSTEQPDVRTFEKKTLYKSNILWDKSATLGSPFVMYYNAAQDGKNAIERIGMAVSKDMIHWTRYGDGPVIDNLKGISGDPQIIHVDDLWVMVYFGLSWGAGKGAFDSFACSRDLVHWTKWNASLIEPSEVFDKDFAHKPWIIKYNGVVYHFYCAVSKQGHRAIAVATSKDLRPAPTPDNTGKAP